MLNTISFAHPRDVGCGCVSSIRRILEDLVAGRISVDEAEKKLKLYSIEEIGEKIKFDLSREVRRGVPEIVFAEHKDADVLKSIIERVLEKNGKVIVSRLREDQFAIIDEFAERYDVRVNHVGRIAVVKKHGVETEDCGGKVGIVTAGTADIPLAEEAKVIVEEMGCKTVTVYDAGIACFMRTVNAVKKLVEEQVDVAIVIAGMEGALPSVIASLLDVPVIGVPASKGYGLGGGGIAALLSMLQACPLGLLVVNIDNSVGAAVAAAMIARRVGKFKITRQEKSCSCQQTKQS